MSSEHQHLTCADASDKRAFLLQRMACVQSGTCLVLWKLCYTAYAGATKHAGSSVYWLSKLRIRSSRRSSHVLSAAPHPSQSVTYAYKTCGSVATTAGGHVA